MVFHNAFETNYFSRILNIFSCWTLLNTHHQKAVYPRNKLDPLQVYCHMKTILCIFDSVPISLSSLFRGLWSSTKLPKNLEIWPKARKYIILPMCCIYWEILSRKSCFPKNDVAFPKLLDACILNCSNIFKLSSREAKMVGWTI